MAGIGYNGTLKLEICGEPGEKELPCFAGGTKNVENKLINGECTISVSNPCLYLSFSSVKIF